MARNPNLIVFLDRDRLNREYYEALRQRTGWNREAARYEPVHPRIIANPRGAAAVKAVIDQIPRVRADLDKKKGC